jgi:cephalosporin hydroxylase
VSTINQANLDRMALDKDCSSLANRFLVESAKYGYSYNFTWLGRPIIQYPQDIVAMQEVLWAVKPDLVVETGIAHGGSLILYASMLELIGGTGRVLGIDVDIRPHNRVEIERHPLFKRIDMIEGSSIEPSIVDQVRRHAADKSNVLVVLDSNHTHAHVLAELRAYAPVVAVGSYCVVFDTVIEDFPPGFFSNRPWDQGDNPKTAVREFLKQSEAGAIQDRAGKSMRFSVDTEIDKKLLISVAPEGYLKRTA